MEIDKKQVLRLLQQRNATWECARGEPGLCMGIAYEHEGYGFMEPVYIESLKLYRRAMCPCEKAAYAQYKQQEEQREKIKRVRGLKHETFSWLGGMWASPDLAEKTFANFEEERQSDAFQAAQNFVAILQGTLVLHGPYGTGKTHLLAALCNALHEQGRSCLFTSATRFFSAVQDRVSRDESYLPLVSKAMHTPLLIWDDLDKMVPSAFRQEILFAIADARAGKRPTAISTNKFAELESIVGGAVYSRLKIGQIEIEMVGGDYREEL